MRETFGNVLLGYLGEWVLYIFQRLQAIIEGTLSYLLEVSWIMLQYSVQAL